jgi:Ca2+-binding EF-hand superfamily protein
MEVITALPVICKTSGMASPTKRQSPGTPLARGVSAGKTQKPQSPPPYFADMLRKEWESYSYNQALITRKCRARSVGAVPQQRPSPKQAGKSDLLASRRFMTSQSHMDLQQPACGSPVTYAKIKNGMARSASAVEFNSRTSPCFGKQALTQEHDSPVASVAVRLPALETRKFDDSKIPPQTAASLDGEEPDRQVHNWATQALGALAGLKKPKSPSSCGTPTTADLESCPWTRTNTEESEKETPRVKHNDGEELMQVPGGATFDESLARLRTGQTSEGEYARASNFYSRFAGGEDLDREHLPQLLKLLGYYFRSSSVLKAKADKITFMTTFDYDELMSFLVTCGESEMEMLKGVFCERGFENGTTTADGITQVLKELDIAVLPSTLEELMTRAGVQGQTHFEFNDFIRVLAAYRACEGFTEEEWTDAKETFEEQEKEADGQMTTDKIANTLLEFFGLRCITHLRELVEEAGDALGDSGLLAKSVCFHEFLVWARCLKNAELMEWSNSFDSADTDGDGMLSFEEVLDWVKQQGFSLFLSAAMEFLESADLADKKDRGFSFEDAVTYLLEVNKSEGFGREDLEELTAAYNKHDTEDEGEITTLQVLDLLRYLGYQVQVDQVKQYADEVDFNGNGTMDVNEYLRLMRIHREVEGNKACLVYMKHKCGKNGLIPHACLATALIETTGCVAYSHVFDEIVDASIKHLSLDQFMILADKARKAVQSMQRQNANFNDKETAVLRKAFNHFNMRNDGILDKIQFLQLMDRCGLPVNTADGQNTVLLMLDEASKAAADEGTGSDAITFGVMLQLWRSMARKNEADVMEQVEKARLAAGFTSAEVTEFRQIFSSAITAAIKRAHEEDEEPLSPAAAPASLPQLKLRRLSAPSLGFTPALQNKLLGRKEASKEASSVEPDLSLETIIGMSDAADMLDFESLKMILSSLKMRLGGSQTFALHRELRILTGSSEGPLKFAHFLGLMRWFIQTDFGCVNELAATMVKGQPMQRDGTPDEGCMGRRMSI